MKSVVYELTGGRSWLNGEDIDFDDVNVHHILHDPITGNTLYGAAYERSFENFAGLTSRQNTVDVENPSTKHTIEALFKYMWQKFKEGDFKAATDHWNQYDPQRQIDFLRDRKSKKYLDYWLSLI